MRARTRRFIQLSVLSISERGRIHGKDPNDEEVALSKLNREDSEEEKTKNSAHIDKIVWLQYKNHVPYCPVQFPFTVDNCKIYHLGLLYYTRGKLGRTRQLRQIFRRIHSPEPTIENLTKRPWTMTGSW